MNDILKELKQKLEGEESQELEEDITIIANQFAKIDELLH
jgi:uncharacterized membrane protein YgaE (UPF0421/DUF939 family)